LRLCGEKTLFENPDTYLTASLDKAQKSPKNPAGGQQDAVYLTNRKGEIYNEEKCC
jgi:hypothetical protein